MKQQLQREEAAPKATEISKVPHPVETGASSVEETTPEAEQTKTGRIESLLERLKVRAKNPLRSKKRALLTFLVLYIAIFLSPLGGYYLAHSANQPSPSVLIVASILVITLCFALFDPSRRYQKTIEEITQTEDVRAVGPLLEFLAGATNYPISRTLQTLQATLKKLVPRMESSDIDQLTPNQITCIYETLKSCDKATPYLERHLSVSLIIKYMEILTQVGERRILPCLERWAKGGGPGEKYSRIRVAAQDCLILLPERIRELEMKGTLLRASGAADVHSETLLRPSVGTGTTDSKHLLRPTDAQRDGGTREE